MAAEFTLLDHLQPFTHVFCWACLGLQRKRRRQPGERDPNHDDREYDPLERQGLLDGHQDDNTSIGANSRARDSPHDGDAMSLHSNIGSSRSHRPDTSHHTYPHFPLHTLTRWQLLTSWFHGRADGSKQPVALPDVQDPATNTFDRPSRTAEGPSGQTSTYDEEQDDVDKLEQAVAQAKLSARKKRLRQASAEARVAENRINEEDVEWGHMQSAVPLQNFLNARPGSAGQDQLAPHPSQPGLDSETEDCDGVPDLAEDGALFASPTSKAKRMVRSSSSSGLSTGSLSSSGTSAADRKRSRARTRKALSDTTQEDNLPPMTK